MTDKSATLKMSPSIVTHVTDSSINMMAKQNQTCNNNKRNTTEITDYLITTKLINSSSSTKSDSDSNDNQVISDKIENNNNNQTSVVDDDLKGDDKDQEVQENINYPTLLEPSSSSNVTNSNNLGEGGEEGEELEEEDEISKRFFSNSRLNNLPGHEELKKTLLLKNRHKTNLFKIKKLKDRKYKRNKNRTRKKLTSQQRQAITTTTSGYGNLLESSSNSNSNNNKPLSTTLKEHFPSLATPINLSTAVQRLIMNKLNSALTSSGSSNNHNNNNNNLGNTASASSQHSSSSVYPGYQKQHNHYMQQSQQSPSYADDQMAFRDHMWDSSMKDHYSGSGSSNSATSPSLVSVGGGDDRAGNSKPVIPIEIIGLDPAVTNSILFGDGGDQNDFLSSSSRSPSPPPNRSPSPAQSIYSSSYNNNNNRYNNVYSPSGPVAVIGGPPKASSVLHVHHFHMQKNQPPTALISQQEASSKLLINHHHHQPSYYNHQPSLEQQQLEQQQQQSQQQQQQDEPSNQQQQQPQQQQQQVFYNDKGDLVYLTVENQGVGGGEQPEQQQDNQETDSQAQTMPQINSGDSSTTTATIYQHQHQPEQNPSDIQQQQDYANGGQDSNSNNDLQVNSNRARKARPSDSKSYQVDPDNKQQLVMVGYKPLESAQNQTTLVDNNNGQQQQQQVYASDGQESKSSLISAPKNFLLTSTDAGRSILKNIIGQQQSSASTIAANNNKLANELTILPIQTVGGETLNSTLISTNNEQSKAKLRSLLSQAPASRITMGNQQENRVPTSLSNSNTINIRPISNSLMKIHMLRQKPMGFSNEQQNFPDSNNNLRINDHALGNGYGLYPFGFKNITGFMQQQQQQRPSISQQQHSLVESIALLKKLQQQQQQMNRNNNQLMIQQGSLFPQLKQLTNSNHHSDDLIQLLQNELKMNASLSNNHHLHNPFNSIAGGNLTSDQQAVLSALAQLNNSSNNSALPTIQHPFGRFEMTQASSLTPLRYLRTQTSNGMNNNFLNNHYYHNHNKPSLLNANPALVGGGGSTSKQLNPADIRHHIQQPGPEEAASEVVDDPGIGTVALAFIFVISLVTLTIFIGKYIFS